MRATRARRDSGAGHAWPAEHIRRLSGPQNRPAGRKIGPANSTHHRTASLSLMFWSIRQHGTDNLHDLLFWRIRVLRTRNQARR